ncbi:MAG: hypothetical protein JWQ38_3123 [Flavipsychrobacter sp.]|nr:hypothetical protein [Flavipsychrobacter sp.]
MLLVVTGRDGFAQRSVNDTLPSGNDTIRLGAITENGKVYPMVLLPEFEKIAAFLDVEERNRRLRLRNDVFITYPYALAAATIFRDVNAQLDTMDRRRDRKKYLKTIDKRLDKIFKDPLKNMSIDQGHVLIKLISRQTGQNCYSIIRQFKGGLSAMVWQSVGVFFNNNLTHEYDPEGRDKEIEALVKDMEASTTYRYQLYQQDAILRKATGK